MQSPAQAYHLGVPVGHVWLDDEKIEIAARVRVVAGMRAEGCLSSKEGGAPANRTRLLSRAKGNTDTLGGDVTALR
jgi:hypothetical protein